MSAIHILIQHLSLLTDSEGAGGPDRQGALGGAGQLREGQVRSGSNGM